MSEAKSFAALSSGLLARKGQARPAMRPQMISTSSTLEDLGWNDMGFDPAPVFEQTESQAGSCAPAPDTEAQNPVAEAQGAIVDAFSTVPSLTSRMVRKPIVASIVASPAARAAPGSRGKAAFTLRLDSERHLKLRLACAVHHRSAQQIVTDALDTYLETLPEIDVSAWNGRTRN